MRDKEFERSRKVLNGKAIELREGGMGKRKNKADSLSNEDEEALWDAGALGFGSPSVLNRTVWFLLSQQFGTRGVQEHTQMRVEDFKIVMHPQQNSIKYTEGLTMTRHGGLVKPDRRVPQRLLPNGTERCPVKLLRKMLSLRPPTLRNTGRLYLTPLRKPTEEVRYGVIPVGENKLKTYNYENDCNGRWNKRWQEIY